MMGENLFVHSQQCFCFTNRSCLEVTNYDNFKKRMFQMSCVKWVVPNGSKTACSQELVNIYIMLILRVHTDALTHTHTHTYTYSPAKESRAPHSRISPNPNVARQVYRSALAGCTLGKQRLIGRPGVAMQSQISFSSPSASILVDPLCHTISSTFG